MGKATGADRQPIAGAGTIGIAVPETTHAFSQALRFRRHACRRMA
jgi:hypothetical protein